MTWPRGAFAGFPDGAVAFLAELVRNNQRAWFEDHLGANDAEMVVPDRRFVHDIGEAPGEAAPGASAEQRIG